MVQQGHKSSGSWKSEHCTLKFHININYYNHFTTERLQMMLRTVKTQVTLNHRNDLKTYLWKIQSLCIKKKLNSLLNGTVLNTYHREAAQWCLIGKEMNWQVKNDAGRWDPQSGPQDLLESGDDSFLWQNGKTKGNWGSKGTLCLCQQRPPMVKTF